MERGENDGVNDDAAKQAPPAGSDAPAPQVLAPEALSTAATQSAPPADDTLILLAARGMLLFPRVVLPIVVGRDRSVRAVQAAVQAERPIGILLQKD
ncbi:MAG: LON peptidase substrate-binding domain-containing protein, partial [Planctomycetes bacterium]|nr:LON peptidase substrate-binding domain-containing protein [Planctomycetota bacterium]